MADATDRDEVVGSIASVGRDMKRGRGRMIAAMALAALAAAVALAFVMRDDGRDSLRAFGRRVNALEAAHFDGFFECVSARSAFSDDEDLRRALRERAARGTGRRADVRSECLAELRALEEGLHELIPPDEIAEELATERRAVHELVGAASAYADRLERAGAEPTRDPSEVEADIDRIARAWYAFRSAHAAINTFLREVLADP